MTNVVTKTESCTWIAFLSAASEPLNRKRPWLIRASYFAAAAASTCSGDGGGYV